MPFGNPIVGSKNLIREAIQSPNFVSGESGWSINRDGSASFNDLELHFDGDFGRIEIKDGEIRVYDINNVLRIKLTTDDGTSFHTPSMLFYDESENVIARITANESGANVFAVSDDTGTNTFTLGSGGLQGSTFVGSSQESSLELRKTTNGYEFAVIPDSNLFNFDWDDGHIAIDWKGIAPNEVPRILLESPWWKSSGAPSIVSIEGSKNGSLRQVAIDTAEVNIANSIGPPAAKLTVDNADVTGFFNTNDATITDAVVTDTLEVQGTILASDMRTARNFQAGAVTTGSTASYQSTGGGGVVAEITIPNPPSRCIDVSIAAKMSNSLAADSCLTSFEVRENSSVGAVIRAAQDIDLQHVGTNPGMFGTTESVSALTNVPNIYIRMMYKVTGGTGTFTNRRLIVTPTP